MIVERVETSWQPIALRRPYRIAHHETTAVELGFVEVLLEGGLRGFGCAAPVAEITGETNQRCRAALERQRALRGEAADVRTELRAAFAEAPAARAALDAALFDAQARASRVPLVELLGRAHRSLPTSVTLGIRDVSATLAEADEYVARGFTVLKVKIGEHLDLDVERLARLREHVGVHISLRADANTGYTVREVERFFERTERLGLEFLEQPTPRAEDDELRALPAAIRARLAADESLLGEEDALRLARLPLPFGIWNIKLAKCGGIEAALGLARFAGPRGIDLMWGCMDESVVGIAAALHAAFACPATRYLDLDGSLDLARDPFRGGFVLEQGRLHTMFAPGFGVEPMS